MTSNIRQKSGFYIVNTFFFMENIKNDIHFCRFGYYYFKIKNINQVTIIFK